jgi:hypothetical protein
MQKIVAKLRSRSLKELAVRASQHLSAQAERIGLSSQVHIPSDSSFMRTMDPDCFSGSRTAAPDLLSHFRARGGPRLFPSFDRPAETVDALRRRIGPSGVRACVEKAEQILEGRFDLLGFEGLSFGCPIAWRSEPLSGKQTPRTHWSRIDYLNPEVSGDKKITWELNRCQFFITLGRAYRLTGDERFAEGFASLAAFWIDDNPPNTGINWASSLEVGFRAIAWVWALELFRDSPRLSAELFSRMLKYLYLHGRHLETYLSTYFSPNTHLTGEALALVYLGRYWPEFRRSVRWIRRGEVILLAELERQVRPDGVYFEQTTYYHRYTADFYTHLYALTAASGSPVDARLTAKLVGLLDHLMFITQPDGSTPFLGDEDGGRLAPLDERPVRDFRAALSTGAVLFGRPDYKFIAGDLAEETVWLLGPDAAARFDAICAAPPTEGSKAFPDGGYYVLRDGWTPDSNYLLVDCGPHGSLSCGHAHADALSLVVSARGLPALLDSGTGAYTGSAEIRDRLRASAAHNTLTVDAESSSVSSGPFNWSQTARCRRTDWFDHPRFGLFEGEHDGFTRIDAEAVHSRAILFVKGDYWTVRDRIRTRAEHELALHFHLAPDSAPEPVHGAAVSGVRVRPDRAAGLELFVAPGREASARLETSQISPVYGKLVEAPAFRVAWRGVGYQECLTLIAPRAVGSTSIEAEASRAGSKRALEIRHDGFTDWLFTGEADEGAHDASDGAFEWAWLRMAEGQGRPSELILYRGRRFEFQGKVVFESPTPVAFMVARWVGSVLYLETDAAPGFTIETFGAVIASKGASQPGSAAGRRS